MSESLFENALTEFMCAEGEALMIENEVIDHVFSPSFEKKMDKLIKRRRKPYFRMINTVGKRVACIALAVFIATATTVMSVDALRNAVFNFFSDLFGKGSAVKVIIDDEHPKTIEEKYEITYDLSEYELIQEENYDEFITKIYVNGDKVIYYKQYTQEAFYGIVLNTENATVKETKINGYDATYYLDNQGQYQLMWDNGKYIFTILANMDKEQAFKLAESVKKVESK